MCGADKTKNVINLYSFVIVLVVTTSIDSPGSDLGQVHDAFFIGIEDEAKERLERLAASKRITPVDITKLAHQVRSRTLTNGLHYLFLASGGHLETYNPISRELKPIDTYVYVLKTTPVLRGRVVRGWEPPTL